MDRIAPRLAATLVALVLALVPSAGLTQAGRPDIAQSALVVPGKQTVFQRIITRPGAALLTAPRADAERVAPARPALDPFTIYYVYARQGGFVQVGSQIRGKPSGWIDGEKTIAWRQSIVVAFNNPATYNRPRTLMFRSREAMDRLLKDERVIPIVKQLRSDAMENRVAAGSPVVAIEPEFHVDIQAPGQFYLFPILSAERQLLHFDVRGQYLEVASVTPEPAPPAPADLSRFRFGFVFAMDTTASMGPYIEATLGAIRQMAQRIEASPVGQNVRFGLIGFRQPTDASPGIEYNTRVYLPLSTDSTIDRFTAALAGMRAARVSTQGFNEDSLGGTYEALKNGGDWSGFDGRFVILVTDAGPKLATQERIRAGSLDTDGISALATAQNTRVGVIHLLTPEGRPNHAYARSQYLKLSAMGGAGAAPPFYIPIPAGNVTDFTANLTQATETIIEGAAAMRRNHVLEPQVPTQGPMTIRDHMRGAFRAMQLAYLGAETNTAVPDVTRSWLIDRDLDEPQRAALDVRLLITKSQLATLRDIMRRMLELGDRDATPGRRSFFEGLRAAVGSMQNDGNILVRGDFQTIGDALAEYLRDLPYHSEVTGMNETDWLRMGASRQAEFIERIRSKAQLYDEIHNTPGRWIRLHADAPEGESATTIPLSDLP